MVFGIRKYSVQFYRDRKYSVKLYRDNEKQTKATKNILEMSRIRNELWVVLFWKSTSFVLVCLIPGARCFLKENGNSFMLAPYEGGQSEQGL